MELMMVIKKYQYHPRITSSCRMFWELLTADEIVEIDQEILGTIEQFCLDLTSRISDVGEGDLRETRMVIIGQGQEERINNIIKCLLEAGVVLLQNHQNFLSFLFYLSYSVTNIFCIFKRFITFRWILFQIKINYFQ